MASKSLALHPSPILFTKANPACKLAIYSNRAVTYLNDIAESFILGIVKCVYPLEQYGSYTLYMLCPGVKLSHNHYAITL